MITWYNSYREHTDRASLLQPERDESLPVCWCCFFCSLRRYLAHLASVQPLEQYIGAKQQEKKHENETKTRNRSPLKTFNEMQGKPWKAGRQTKGWGWGTSTIVQLCRNGRFFFLILKQSRASSNLAVREGWKDGGKIGYSIDIICIYIYK